MTIHFINPIKTQILNHDEKKLLFYLMFFVLFVGISCSRSASCAATSRPQKDTLTAEFVEYIVAIGEARRERESYDDGIPRTDHLIGGFVPFSLVFINGERCHDFPEALKDGHLRAFTIDELKRILKKKNYMLDGVKILKNEKSLEKYRKGGFVVSGAENRLKIVYEIKAHLIDPKGEIYNYVWKRSEFPGGNEAYKAFLEKNVRHPKEMFNTGVHGFVDVECVIEKDGTIEVQKAYPYLKDQSGNPCLDSTIIKRYEQEALRVIEKMPRCEPGRKENGEKVRENHNIAIIFDENVKY